MIRRNAPKKEKTPKPERKVRPKKEPRVPKKEVKTDNKKKENKK